MHGGGVVVRWAFGSCGGVLLVDRLSGGLTVFSALVQMAFGGGQRREKGPGDGIYGDTGPGGEVAAADGFLPGARDGAEARAVEKLNKLSGGC